MMEPLELDEYAPSTRMPLGSLNPNKSHSNTNNTNNILRKKPPVASTVNYKAQYEELLERQSQWEAEKQQLMECLGKQMDENRSLKSSIEVLECKLQGMNSLEDVNTKKQSDMAKVLSESEEVNRRLQRKLANYKTKATELMSENRTLKGELKSSEAEVQGLQQQVVENQSVEDELVNALQKAQDELDSFKKGKSSPEEQLTLNILRNDIREGNMQLLEQFQHVISTMSIQSYSGTRTTQPGTAHNYSDKYSPSSSEGEEGVPRNHPPNDPSSLMVSLTPKELFAR
eukprot:TRINITY_DN5600_c0_g1_i1.p1 TRINITY_DN5600_c0_g1~~TRINITY_DN5600_c0_g1_i1.p1  ORF type:complete len:286 (+),score=81.19 TRINITY_DN5600_c0_g1_i1:46-903(+)